jgi:hypothetical protein
VHKTRRARACLGSIGVRSKGTLVTKVRIGIGSPRYRIPRVACLALSLTSYFRLGFQRFLQGSARRDSAPIILRRKRDQKLFRKMAPTPFCRIARPRKHSDVFGITRHIPPMTTYEFGDVLLAPVPLTNHSVSKRSQHVRVGALFHLPSFGYPVHSQYQRIWTLSDDGLRVRSRHQQPAKRQQGRRLSSRA